MSIAFFPSDKIYIGYYSVKRISACFSEYNDTKIHQISIIYADPKEKAMKNKLPLKITCALFAAILVFSFFTLSPAYATEFSGEVNASGAILIEAKTGAVLYEKNADTPLPPASVTKVMTMLLVMEALDSNRISLSDTVTVSENAANMGGSQVYLEAGESLSVHELLKCVVVSSANDACVALAEFISGSEESFVAEMNKRAKELGMKNTFFENTNGLDDTTQNHLTSARDIAIMSAELINEHPKILEYSSIWMDSIRNGSFTLTNTNRLIRFYSGCNGLKTGSTSKAKFCISASAERNGMQLICVIMGAPSRDERNELAKRLLDHGFANYVYQTPNANIPEKIRVKGAKTEYVGLSTESFSFLSEKQDLGRCSIETELPQSLVAPINKGDTVGKVRYILNGKTMAEKDIVCTENAQSADLAYVFAELMKIIF